MKHLVFATKFEADRLLENAEDVSNSRLEVYKSGVFSILICGVGLIKSSRNMSLYLQSSFYQAGEEIVNLGIAGAIDDALPLFSVHKVKRLGCYDYVMHGEEMNPIYAQNFPEISLDSAEGLFLMSSLHPLWQEKENRLLKELNSQLVDMEAYSLAQACQEEGVDLQIYKCISDFTRRNSREEFLAQAQKAIAALGEFVDQNL